jgi:hypothetical protein
MAPEKPTTPGKHWPKGLFPLSILALLALGLVGHLLIQTSIQEQGFELASLQTQAESLAAQQAILEATLDKQSTPLQLAYAASQLGMVANPYTTFISLETGQVTGLNKPVVGDEVPHISARPSIPSNAAPLDVAGQATGVQP